MDDLQVLKKYHRLLMPYLGVFLAAIAFDIGMTLLGLAAPLFVRVLFDYAYPYRDLALLNTMIAAIVVIYFIHFFLSVASDYLQIYIGQETNAELSEKVFHTIQKLPLKFHQEKRPGDLIIRITDDAAKTVEMITSVLPTLIIDGGRFLIILAIALAINPGFTLLALMSVPLYILEARFYAGGLARVEQEAINAESNIFTRAQEKLFSIRTIKAFGQERNESISFAVLLRRRFRVAVKGKVLEVLRTFTNSVTLQMWSLFLTWYLGYQVVKGTLSIGDIVALLIYISLLEEPIKSFINIFTEWKTSLVSMRRLDEVFDTKAEDAQEFAKSFERGSGEVAIQNVSFAYADGKDVLHGIAVKFPPKSVSAIVGSSGSGKTTLVNLMLRFFSPTDGMIFIDGQGISEVRVRELRGRIGIVSQEAAIFDDTVMNNILYGNEGLERGDAMRAARLAGAHDFIEKLTGGYDAPAGMGGELLSAGQRQRIAIARVLLRDPEIIIFDEATSALDAESEYRIQEVITSLRRTKTVIVIAHRLSTIKSADRIFVLEDGHFVEEGNFDELIDRHGAFYRFYWRQFGGLAAFRQQLDLEIERAGRYGSHCCLALLKIRGIYELESKDNPLAAERFMEAIDFLIKKSIRRGDNSAILDKDTILILLPEIDKNQFAQFFKRMQKILPDKENFFFAGMRITKRIFRTPEEIIHALKIKTDAAAEKEYLIIDEDDLAK